MIGLAEFLSGAAMVAFSACGLFFLKIWQASRDRFFLYFCSAFLILAGERIVLLLTRQFSKTAEDGIVEASSWVYLMRLFAFCLILVAVIEKNRNGRAATKSSSGLPPA